MRSAGGRKKRFETVLPEGYVPVYTLDAADKRVGLRLNAAALAVMALVAAIGWWGIRPTELAAHYNLWHSLLWIGGMLLYLVLPELRHGAAYQLPTRRPSPCLSRCFCCRRVCAHRRGIGSAALCCWRSIWAAVWEICTMPGCTGSGFAARTR